MASIVKAAPFNPEETAPAQIAPAAAPAARRETKDGKLKVVSAEDQSENFLEKIAHETFAARRRANALRSNTRLAAACAAGHIDAEKVVELTGRIAVEAMVEMGFDVSEPTSLMDGVGPLFVRAAADITARLARSEHSEASLEHGARQAVKAMLALSRNNVISRFAQDAWPDDLDAKTTLRLSMTNLMSSIAVETQSFSFMMPADKAMRHASLAISKAFVEHADRYFETDISRPSRLMLMQSLLRNASDLYLACWQEEKARVLPRIEALLPRVRTEALQQQLEEMVQARVPKIEAAFRQRFDETMTLAVDYGEQLFERLHAAAGRKKNAPRPA